MIKKRIAEVHIIFFHFGPVHGLILQHGSVIALVALVNSEDYCDNPIQDNSVLSPKPLHLVIKR
jgi:hypothetical protein